MSFLDKILPTRNNIINTCNAKEIRRLWCNVYVSYIQDGNAKEYCKDMANAAVSAYKEKFIKINLK